MENDTETEWVDESKIGAIRISRSKVSSGKGCVPFPRLENKMKK